MGCMNYPTWRLLIMSTYNLLQLFETSARENINVEETFRAITKLVIKSRREQKARLENDGGGGAHGGGRGGQGNDHIR